MGKCLAGVTLCPPPSESIDPVTLVLVGETSDFERTPGQSSAPGFLISAGHLALARSALARLFSQASSPSSG
jgi:hypothetical protein